MERVIITLTDDKGTVKLQVTPETAEKLQTDHKYASEILTQARAAGNSQANISLPQPTAPTMVLPQPGIVLAPCTTPLPFPVVPATPTVTDTPLSRPQSQETEFKHETTMLLLDLTRTYKHIYHTSKMSFYKKLEHSFKEKGLNFSNEKIRKKMNNMLTTYKRAKDRSRATGEGKIAWEYYSQMDDIFGGSGVGTAPPGTIASTPLFVQLPSSAAGHPPDEQPGPSTSSQPPTKKRGKSHPSFQDTYQVHAERRTVALESLVQPEQTRWRQLREKRRRLFEKKMITCMGQIVTQLKELGEQQKQITELLKEANKK